ncbi:MAG TPA: response regulator transcription factor [Pirellulales bacterium]|nr:response regulator transcription factor [Pirellulales bacterium]
MMQSKTKTRKRAARVLIVDDHPAVREALAIRIAAQPDLEVCGEAADAQEALRLAADADPDVAVVNIALKSGNGLDLIRRLKARNAAFRAIVWSMYSEQLYAERALRAGAMGYITKEQATGQIIEAIRQVLDGKIYLGPAMTEKLLKRAVGQAGPELARSPVAALSNRELEVLRLIGNGVKTAEIAKQLNLSVKTVETYRIRIRQKLDLSDGTDLARYAAQWVLEQGGAK